MNLLLLKSGLSKSWLWLKHHWYIPLSLLAIVVSYVLFKGKTTAMIEALMKNREGYKEQVRKVDEIREQQVAERDKHLEERDEKLKLISQKHEEELLKLAQGTKARVEELKKENLAEKLKEEFDL